MEKKMKDLNLTSEEQELLESVESGEWKPVKDMPTEREMLANAGKNARNRRMNIDIKDS
jgi:DNA-binding GntR family transcriptional regulator